MSRCFPYPLPVCVRNGFPGEALIESIKLHKEREKSNVEKGKERREKKEKRKEKKRIEQKGLPSKIGNAPSCMLIDTKALYQEKCDIKGNEVEAEQLENSGLTEEYGQPSNSEMSDSTLSKKRKRHSSSHGSSSSCSQTHGNVLRIRLSSQNQRGADALLSKDQQCSTSGRVPRAAPQNMLLNEKLSNSSEIDIKRVTKSADRTLHSTNRSFAEAKSHKDERRWMKLCNKMDAFVPLSLQMEQNNGDEQWLFGTKPRGGQITKTCRDDNNGVLCNRGVSFSLWPRTHYLPQADIHALPYTIPF